MTGFFSQLHEHVEWNLWNEILHLFSNKLCCTDYLFIRNQGGKFRISRFVNLFASFVFKFTEWLDNGLHSFLYVFYWNDVVLRYGPSNTNPGKSPRIVFSNSHASRNCYRLIQRSSFLLFYVIKKGWKNSWHHQPY